MIKLRIAAVKNLQLCNEWITARTLAEKTGSKQRHWLAFLARNYVKKLLDRRTIVINFNEAYEYKLTGDGYRAIHDCLHGEPKKRVNKPAPATHKCAHCGKSEPEVRFTKHNGSNRYRSLCNLCRNAYDRAKAKGKREQQQVGDPKANAFDWRNFVQPVPMAADKWSHLYKPDTTGSRSFVI